MDKKRIILISSAAVILFGAVIITTLVKKGGIESKPQTSAPQSLAPGSSLVSEKGKVLTTSGEEVKTDVSPNSPLAPRQSAPLSGADVQKAEQSGISKTVKLVMSLGSISPAAFEVKKGEIVTLIVAGGDDRAHILNFTDPSLKAVSIGLNGKETRLIIFPAPNKTGEYSFYCDVPGHKNRGETGKMIVR